MTATARVVLGAATLNRKWWLDVNNGTYGAPDWLPVGGISDFKATRENTLQDDSDFDSAGAKSSAATAYGWTVEGKLQRKVTVASPTVYDPGQEKIRAAANGLGLANVVDIRFYEMTTSGPKVEAWRGYAIAGFAEEGGAMDALDTVSMTLTGKGALTSITHPDAAHAAPVLTSLNPSTAPAAGGTIIHITGSGFFWAGVNDVAASGVKLAAHVSPYYFVEDDCNIWAAMPAETAGTTNFTVTNSIGASNGLPFITT